MDARIVGACQRVVGLDGRVQRQLAGRDIADLQAGLGGDQLALVVDDGDGAGHLAELMDL